MACCNNQSDLTFSQYQCKTGDTAIYPEDQALPYLVAGLGSEAGEVLGRYKKFIRGDINENEMKDSLAGELGDVLWYVAELCKLLEVNMGDVAQGNIDKLQLRLKHNVIKGDGEDRIPKI